MSATTQLTLKRVAALREMADLGCTTMAACSLLELDYGSIYYLNDKYGINLRACKLGRPGRIRDKILRDFGKPGLTQSMMAARYGTTKPSIRVIISQLRKEGKLPPVQQRC